MPWEFRCNDTGRCIPQTWVCDGEGDCQDHADEHPSRGCTITNCDKDSFKCADNSGCISKLQYCDNHTDCLDKSDEPSTCKEGCMPGEFLCKTGLCIPNKMKCDGKFDCLDGDDEGSFCHVEANYCKALGWFMCHNGVCINDTLVCDGENNCGDFSDETKCSKYTFRSLKCIFRYLGFTATKLSTKVTKSTGCLIWVNFDVALFYLLSY